VTNVYDGFGQLSASTLAMGGASRALSHQYDLDGNRKRITHPPAIISTHPHLGLLTVFYDYTYDGLGRPTSVVNAGGHHLAGWAYDAMGRLEKLSRIAPAFSLYGYDSVSRPASITHDLYGTAYDLTLGFTYNPASQVQGRSSSNGLYAANSAYEVVRPYSANGLNQYTAAGPAAFAYDSNGNLTSDGSSTFVYDVENRLVSASGAKTAALVYDPLGRLFQVSGGASPLQFLHDGDSLVAEYESADVRPRLYVHGVGADVPVIWFEGGGGGRGLYTDHQGSIVAAAHPTNGYLAINGYDAWGIPNAGNQGRFGYTGQAWIPELGMVLQGQVLLADDRAVHAGGSDRV
jgi:YD repeat-containing protein